MSPVWGAEVTNTPCREQEHAEPSENDGDPMVLNMDGTVPGNKYGYELRIRDTFTDGAGKVSGLEKGRRVCRAVPLV